MPFGALALKHDDLRFERGGTCRSVEFNSLGGREWDRDGARGLPKCPPASLPPASGAGSFQSRALFGQLTKIAPEIDPNIDLSLLTLSP